MSRGEVKVAVAVAVDEQSSVLYLRGRRSYSSELFKVTILDGSDERMKIPPHMKTNLLVYDVIVVILDRHITIVVYCNVTISFNPQCSLRAFVC